MSNTLSHSTICLESVPTHMPVSFQPSDSVMAKTGVQIPNPFDGLLSKCCDTSVDESLEILECYLVAMRQLNNTWFSWAKLYIWPKALIKYSAFNICGGDWKSFSILIGHLNEYWRVAYCIHPLRPNHNWLRHYKTVNVLGQHVFGFLKYGRDPWVDMRKVLEHVLSIGTLSQSFPSFGVSS